jgi:alpha-beta hydrolase superfamily lysophospholipase
MIAWIDAEFKVPSRLMPAFEEIRVTLPDRYAAYARYWKPPRCVGAILYHQGIQSHCDWYAGSASALCEAGFAVLQVDRRGSGRNAEPRGHAESAEQLITDALAARDVLLDRSGCDTYHVVGVSWGGKLAVAGYVTDPVGVASLSLVTPGLFPLIGVGKEQAAKIGFAMLYEPETSFDIPLNDPAMFTASERWRRFHQSDPLTLRRCTAGFYLASRRMDRIVARLAGSPPIPLHLMLAGDERIIDNDKTEGFIGALRWPECMTTLYATARHSIEYDAPDAYFRDLCAFIERVAAAERSGA